MKKRLIIIFGSVVALCAFAIAAFYYFDAPTLRQKPYKIALILRSSANPAFTEMERAARKAEYANAVNVVVRKVNNEIDASEQIRQLRDLANQDIDAVIIDPIDSMALLPIIKQYQSANIPVINLESRFDIASMTQFAMTAPPFVGIDNEKAAYEVGQKITSQIATPTNILLLTGNSSSMLSDERKRGALKAFAENPYCLVVEKRVVYFDAQLAKNAVREFYNNYSTLGAVFCVDDVVACAVADELASLGKQPVLVTGFGDLLGTETRILEDRIAYTVAERSGRQVDIAIKYAIDALNNKTVPATTYVDYAIVDKSMLMR